MKVKSKVGMGVRKMRLKKKNLKIVITAARRGLDKKAKNARTVIKSALLAA